MPFSFVYSQVLNATEAVLDSMVLETMNDTYNFRFEEATSITDRMIKNYPEMPQGYLYKCAVRLKMIEEGCAGPRDSANAEVKDLIDNACKLSAALVEKNPNDLMANFCYAGSLVYRAGYEARGGDWFSVMSDGVKTRKLLEKAIALDPHFYDAYSGIGAFNYYASHIPWYLKPLAYLLGVEGSEEKGISELTTASQFGKYSKVEAANFLASVVYPEKKDYASSARLMEQLHDRYPWNLDFTRTLCWDYHMLQSYGSVVTLSDSALTQIRFDGRCHAREIGYLRFMRGEAYAKLNLNSSIAVADFTKMIQIGQPKFLLTWSYYSRGSVYVSMGKRVNAISDFEKVVSLKGDSYTYDQARIALDSLKEK